MPEHGEHQKKKIYHMLEVWTDSQTDDNESLNWNAKYFQKRFAVLPFSKRSRSLKVQHF